MLWPAKAQELLRPQYASVGGAARASLSEAVLLIEKLSPRTEGAEKLAERCRRWFEAAHLLCRFVPSLLLAGELHERLETGSVPVASNRRQIHMNRDHVWHMETLAGMCKANAYQQVDVRDSSSTDAAIEWWQELTGAGGQGMVVKPLEFVARGRHGLVQPAIKCRGREYLRIIYGPEYLLPGHLEPLRSRAVSTKRSLALRESALGIEALERFVRREPLRRVHEGVFGVLALESEPVDPRL